jgi:FkbM family methyltransferase
MGPIKKTCVYTVSWLMANRFSQEALQRLVVYANYFMGIGAGAHAASSGEAAVLRNLKRYGTAPLVVFDVGANQGQFLELALAMTSQQQMQIHCFEPSLAAFSILNKQVVGHHNVLLNNFGLGAQVAQVELYYDQSGSGLASLTQRRLGHFGIDHSQHESVRIETLDKYCEANGIEEIALLKIDVEGHELDVLRGAKKMLERKAIQAVTFEFGGCNIDTRTFLQDFWYFFQSIGMIMYRITPAGYLYPLENYFESMEQMVTTNYIAIQRG